MQGKEPDGRKVNIWVKKEENTFRSYSGTQDG